MAANIESGMRVETAGGTLLGKIKEVRDDVFLVDVPHAFDYWLDTDIVTEVTDGVAKLAIADDEIGAYKRQHPDDKTVFEGALPEELDPQNVQANEMLTPTNPKPHI